MKHFRSGGVAKAMSKTLKNGVFEARRRRIFFENRDFYEFAPPLVFGDLETRGGQIQRNTPDTLKAPVAGKCIKCCLLL